MRSAPATDSTSVVVLPVPGPARTSSGPSARGQPPRAALRPAEGDPPGPAGYAPVGTRHGSPVAPGVRQAPVEEEELTWFAGPGGCAGSVDVGAERRRTGVVVGRRVGGTVACGGRWPRDERDGRRRRYAGGRRGSRASSCSLPAHASPAPRTYGMSRTCPGAPVRAPDCPTAARCRKLSGVTLRALTAVPPRPSHVDTRDMALGGPARLLQRRALRAVVVQRLAARGRGAARRPRVPPATTATAPP